VAPWFNALVFHNGFHTVHHERPGLHWSALPEAHAKIAARIPEPLNSSTPFRYMLDTYVAVGSQPEHKGDDRASAPVLEIAATSRCSSASKHARP
jgi:fatty acid desaturase